MTPPAAAKGPPSVAVVGAGLSGLTAARQLVEHGWRARVFEKSRGCGGRMARRREGERQFDHGAQYFTARSDDFRREVADWTKRGWVERWPARIMILDRGSVERLEDREPRYVGVPGMSTVCRQLGSELEVHTGTRVARVHHDVDGWRLQADQGEELGSFDVVLVTTPPRQAVPLLAEAADLARRAAAVVMDPCWALLATFAEEIGRPFDAAFVHESPLSWIANNASKPGRPQGEAWVLHASPQWSADNLGLAPEVAAQQLLEALFEALRKPTVVPTFSIAHLWRYSIARNPLEQGCLWDPQRGIAACGDWCRGSRVEGAFLSGKAAAERILADCA